MTAVGTGVSDTPQHRHLPAIDGLRAVAVFLVVLNHADVPGFERGYIGVDMFFAISGFLITGRIISSIETGSTQPLIDFWAGRARRILPALILTIIVTCLASALVLAPAELRRVSGYGLAADLFVVNNLISWKGGNYFAGPLRELPFLHLWSLAVEEQFYLLWPLALGPVGRGLARLTRVSYRRVIAVTLALTSIGSLAASVVLTQTSARWAFYGLPTRVYEFALGAAAALFWIGRVGHRARQAAAMCGMAGLAAVLVAAPASGIGFPSAWPLLAVGGTVLLIIGTVKSAAPGEGLPARWCGDLLGSRPMRVVGRYSYSWYLWHWPVVVLGTIAWGATWGRVASVASIGAAAATFHLVEQPIRFRAELIRSHARSLVVGALLVVVGAAACGGLAWFADIRLDDPYIADLTKAEESFVTAGCRPDRVLLGLDVCLGGSDGSNDPMILLVGDSHAAQWVAAFSEAGRRNGFRVALRQVGNCPAVPYLRAPTVPNSGCEAFQRETAALYGDPRVDAVVMGEALTSRETHGAPADWFRAAETAVDAWSKPVGILVDPPRYDDPLQCLARGGTELGCTSSKAYAFERLGRYASEERSLEKERDVTRFDLGKEICDTDPCPLKIDGVWISARAGHLTRPFTLRYVDRIGTFVQNLLARAEGTGG